MSLAFLEWVTKSDLFLRLQRIHLFGLTLAWTSCSAHNVIHAGSYLALSNCLGVYDCDDARHQGAPPGVAVDGSVIFCHPRGQCACQLRHHLPNHRQAALQCLHDKRQNGKSEQERALKSIS